MNPAFMETDRQEGKDDLADGTYYIIADFIGFVKMVLKKSLEKRIFFFEKSLDKAVHLWYNRSVPERRFLCKDRRWCGSMAEQLICNQQVVGSTPITSSNEFTQGELFIWEISRVAKGGRL